MQSLSPNFDSYRAVYVDPMPLPMIESIPEFAALTTLLREHSLSDIVYKVLGGSPLAYSNFKWHVEVKWLAEQCEGGTTKDEVTAMVRDYLHDRLCDALDHLQNTRFTYSSSTRDIVRVMQDLQVTSVCTSDLYYNHNLRLSAPNMLLHQTPHHHIEPCSQALKLLIARY